jgi:hypothetical protein
VDESRDNYKPPIQNSSEARKTAELIGTELAKKEYRIIVYSAKPGFIECDVVRGYVKGKGKVKDEKSIIVEFPQDQEGASAFSEFKGHEELFDPRRDTTEAWEPSFFVRCARPTASSLSGAAVPR